VTDRRHDIIGRRFPSVAGRALSGEVVHFPEDLAGAPALLLCAYRRGTQADADRWAAFVERELPDLMAYELPIIPSLVWRPLQGWIDGGMRGGVPPSLWSTTVTLYGQGAAAREFVGDSGGLRTQVVLLDASGVVAFHDARGFSEQSAARLKATVVALAG
jgi:hypothetical protein